MFGSSCFAILLLAGLVGGCESAATPSTAASPHLGRSVIAGRTTFVEVPIGQGALQVAAYTVSGQSVCPECESVAEEYMKTGVLRERVCKSCGSTINVGQGQYLNQP